MYCTKHFNIEFPHFPSLPGELTAHCMGPSLLAFCELYNHHDGTFTLNVKPQEPGRHMLEVKYGGIHVPSKYPIEHITS